MWHSLFIWLFGLGCGLIVGVLVGFLGRQPDVW